jgi:hypothetical protein
LNLIPGRSVGLQRQLAPVSVIESVHGLARNVGEVSAVDLIGGNDEHDVV